MVVRSRGFLQYSWNIEYIIPLIWDVPRLCSLGMVQNEYRVDRVCRTSLYDGRPRCGLHLVYRHSRIFNHVPPIPDELPPSGLLVSWIFPLSDERIIISLILYGTHVIRCNVRKPSTQSPQQASASRIPFSPSILPLSSCCGDICVRAEAAIGSRILGAVQNVAV